ncbi:MAG: hypothetical protein JWO22_1230 [Frankiales bacterium]|nr:hypothetical protein [Frankiales bacterium]
MSSQPFIPVRLVEAGAPSRQIFTPALQANGEPVWQPGDAEVHTWDINNIGWAHGDVAARQDSPGVRGRVYLTSSRVVLVATGFARGSRYSGYDPTDVIVGAIATKVSQRRAEKASANTYLVGQMRLPWLQAVAFAKPDAAKALRGEVRLMTQHRTAFGDLELATLLLRHSDPSHTENFVNWASHFVRGDRQGWASTSEGDSAALARVPVAADVRTDPGKLPVILYPGARIPSADTASQGLLSSRSFT